MISVLLVAPADAAAPAPPPSIELLRCSTADEALETLSRNRRIDAVLFFEDASARQTASLLEAEGPAWPPLFRAGRSAVPGVTGLDPASIFEDLRRRLGE
jgi:hypothetical protein